MIILKAIDKPNGMLIQCVVAKIPKIIKEEKITLARGSDRRRIMDCIFVRFLGFSRFFLCIVNPKQL